MTEAAFLTGACTALVAEMRANFGDELQQIDKRLDRIEERCAERLVCALQQKQE